MIEELKKEELVRKRFEREFLPLFPILKDLGLVLKDTMIRPYGSFSLSVKLKNLHKFSTLWIFFNEYSIGAFIDLGPGEKERVSVCGAFFEEENPPNKEKEVIRMPFDYGETVEKQVKILKVFIFLVKKIL